MMTGRNAQNRSLLRILILAIPVAWLAFACSQTVKSPEAATTLFSVKDFNPVANWNPAKPLYLDFTEAKEKGFIIPTARQVEGGLFRLEFSIKNTGDGPQNFRYKIYYQNESYKFPERDPADSTRQHPLAWENFYGSWEDTGITFAETGIIPADHSFHRVEGTFRIVGNPRNEQRYFTDGVNTRWKRNPRVGNYSFMLVVTASENTDQQIIPKEVADISKTAATGFINPFHYFLYGAGKTLKNTVIQQFPAQLTVISSADPAAGIYINPGQFSPELARQFGNDLCSQDSSFYRQAAFEQFIHYVDPSTKMNHIPVIADVLKDNYSRTDYNWNRRYYRKDELVAITATTAKRPCETVIADAENHKITIFNPKSTWGDWKKQNVGVITRHGMTYGKWTVKCKLTELINKNGLWNGLTNAIWLITQDLAEWNYRRDCTTEGYLATYYGGQQDQRVKNVGYSEIDFEILKTVPYCPNWLLPPAYSHGVDDQYNMGNWNVPFPEEIVAADRMITVSCTNWDMACWQPADFHEGCWPVHHEGKTFWAHRWDKNYRALTQKTPEPDDELFGSEYYYFQIDWRPTEITWRVGPSKDKMRVVGYMDDKVTSIPNNQMLLIITQEFHNTKWWIGSPYAQDNIPFPANDIIGEIYEVTVE